MFSADALERARSFADTRARPLERVRLAHLLGEAEPGDVVCALRAFATTDGGLGQALEPDCRAPESSALAVLTGLDILRQHRGSDPASRHLLGTLIAWLVAQVERDEQGRCVWPFLPATAQASPHAPWWDQSQPGELAATFETGAAEIAWLDRTVYHLDGPGALRHLDTLLDIGQLDAIQFVYGDGAKPASRWMHVFKRIQAGGKNLHITIEPREVDTFMENLRPEGVMLQMEASSVEEADAVLKKIAGWK